jgi:hypothetical protein
MSEEQLAELVSATARQLTCPCGVQRSVAPSFHKRSTNHDCVHHPRLSCGHCRTVDRLIAGVEARLYVEAQHGPFIVTRWAA